MTASGHFDDAAATWDLAERRVALAQAVAAAIAARVALSGEMAVMDFGCGTGLVTLALAPSVGSITGADTSSAMLATLEEKAKAQGTPLSLLLLEATATPPLGGPYDLVVSSMTLHHVDDVAALFHQFHQHLRPGGRIALADLDEEDGGFHGDTMSVPHRGFSRAQIQNWLEEASFREILLETATVTRKEGKDYPVFLASARRI